MSKALNLERDVKREINKLLDAYAPLVFYEMHVPYGYGKPPLDYNVTMMGWALYIEAKAPGKYPTPQQRESLKKAHEAGAACFIISRWDGIEALARYLARNTGFDRKGKPVY